MYLETESEGGSKDGSRTIYKRHSGRNRRHLPDGKLGPRQSLEAKYEFVSLYRAILVAIHATHQDGIISSDAKPAANQSQDFMHWVSVHVFVDVV